MLAFFACTKITNTNIGGGLFPPVDGVTNKDTVLDVVTKNQSFDTVAVGFSDDHVLGYTNDPVFGNTTAAINFQVALPNSVFSFGGGVPKTSLQLDSIVLSFSYKGASGDKTSHLGLHVYEMDPENKFSVNSAYNNKVSFEKGNELTEFNTAKDVDIATLGNPDTLKQFNEDATNQVRIRLNSAFGERLLNDYDSSREYQDDSTFHNYVKGFIVEAEQRGNALLSLNLSDTSTRLSVYYHYPNGSGGVDSAVRRFATNALSCASSNSINRNYFGTDISNNFPSSLKPQDSLIYIQTSPGTYAKIKIPGLDSLPNIIVHRAEILMQQVPDVTSFSDTAFTAPNLFLAAYIQDSAKRFAVPFDIQYSSGSIVNLSTFGISPIKKTDPFSGKVISTYSFDISRYVQSVVTRNDSAYDFILWAPYNYYLYPSIDAIYSTPIATPALNSVAIGRVRIGGGNNSRYKMRLHIVYSLP